MMLNKSTAAVLDVLTANLPTDRARHIGEKGGAIMQVVVEKLGGARYSVAHYFEQCGDLCCDPDVTFAKTPEGHWVVCEFQQALPPVYTVAHEVDDRGYPTKINQRAAADLGAFVAEWMRNIVRQQGGDKGTLAGLRRVVAECQRAEARTPVEEPEPTPADPEPETPEAVAEREAVEAYNAWTPDDAPAPFGLERQIAPASQRRPSAGGTGSGGFRRPVQMSLF